MGVVVRGGSPSGFSGDWLAPLLSLTLSLSGSSRPWLRVAANSESCTSPLSPTLCPALADVDSTPSLGIEKIGVDESAQMAGKAISETSGDGHPRNRPPRSGDEDYRDEPSSFCAGSWWLTTPPLRVQPSVVRPEAPPPSLPPRCSNLCGIADPGGTGENSLAGILAPPAQPLDSAALAARTRLQLIHEERYPLSLHFPLPVLRTLREEFSYLKHIYLIFCKLINLFEIYLLEVVERLIKRHF